MKKISLFLLIIGLISSCEKYREFSDLEEVENTFTGTLSVSALNADVDIEYSSIEGSGIYSFIWDNPTKGAVISARSEEGEGSILISLEDSRGHKVLDESMIIGAEYAFSEEGKKGKWVVKIEFKDVESMGSIDLGPVN